MSSFVEPSRSRAVSRLALLAALTAGLAGCSSDFSRFGESQWATKPQASPEVTGSVQPAAPAHKIETSALPPPTYGGSGGTAPPPPPARPGATRPAAAPHQPPPPAPGAGGGHAPLLAPGAST